MPARHIRLLPQGALLPLFWLSLFAPTAQAAETETIQLSPGFARRIKLNQVIGTVVIGSPDVVDATFHGDKAMLLTAKRVTGSAATNVVVFNQQGTEIFNVAIAVGSQDSGKVEIHSKGRAGGLHEYWHIAAYQFANASRINSKPFRGAAFPRPLGLSQSPLSAILL